MTKKELEKLLQEGKSTAEIVAVVEREHKQKKVEDGRRKIRDKMFADGPKLSKAQQEAVIWQYLAKNTAHFRQWYGLDKRSEQQSEQEKEAGKTAEKIAPC